MIRRATSEDAAEIAPLLAELGYPSTAAQVEARLAALPADEIVLVAEIDGRVAGIAGLRVERLIERDEPSGRLTALVVGSRWRSSGVGRSLVEAVEEDARTRGCDRIVLSSGDHRPEAHAFYRRLGYDVTGKRFAKALDA